MALKRPIQGLQKIYGIKVDVHELRHIKGDRRLSKEDRWKIELLEAFRKQHNHVTVVGTRKSSQFPRNLALHGRDKDGHFWYAEHAYGVVGYDTRTRMLVKKADVFVEADSTR